MCTLDDSEYSAVVEVGPGAREAVVTFGGRVETEFVSPNPFFLFATAAPLS